jgi:hypothetical protein
MIDEQIRRQFNDAWPEIWLRLLGLGMRHEAAKQAVWRGFLLGLATAKRPQGRPRLRAPEDDAKVRRERTMLCMRNLRAQRKALTKLPINGKVKPDRKTKI